MSPARPNKTAGGIKLGIKFYDLHNPRNRVAKLILPSFISSASSLPVLKYTALRARQALLFLPRLMRILLTISIFALAALLWAAVSIIQHIRHSRRRRILRVRQATPVASVLGLSGLSLPPLARPHSATSAVDPDFAAFSFAALAPRPTPAPLYRSPAAQINFVDRAAPPPPSPAPARLQPPVEMPLPVLPPPSNLHPSTVNMTGLNSSPQVVAQTAPQSPVQRLVAILDAAHAIDVAPASAPQFQHVQQVHDAPPSSEVFTELVPASPMEAPVAEPATPVASLPLQPAPPLLNPAILNSPLLASDRRPPTRALPLHTDPLDQITQATASLDPANQPDTQLRRPVRSVHPAHPAAPFIPTRRPDWAYFNKDMGDLSDPVPSRIRDRARSR